MSGTVESYGVWQDDGGDWHWSYMVDGDECDRGTADTEDEARKEAYRYGLCSRDYETVSEAAEFVEATVLNGGTVILEQAASGDSLVVRAWYTA